ncbi:MAG: RIP metalloprotease RseP [Methylocystaceae bacterium]
MGTIINIILAILVLALLILVHEWGHFLAARRAGIKILEFSIGFGPLLWKLQRDTQYSIRAIPLGGYVSMLGENLGDENQEPDSYMAKSPAQRSGVAFAGPFANFLLAVVLFIYLFTFIGTPILVNKPIIGEVISDKPAAAAGLKVGDYIKTVNGETVTTWQQMVNLIKSTPEGQKVSLQVMRNNQLVNLDIRPIMVEGRPVIGIQSKVEFKKLTLFQGIKEGFRQTFSTTGMLLKGLGMMVTGQVKSTDIAGPIGITKMIGDAAAGGWVYLVNFTAMLSINLGLLNLLPIPALDGSKIIFAGIEAVRGRPIEPERENMIHLIGFFFLIGLMILVTFNDIVRLISG